MAELMRWLCFVQIHNCFVKSSVAAVLNAEVSRWSFLLQTFWRMDGNFQKTSKSLSKKLHLETSAFNMAATELFTKRQLWIWTKQSHPMSSAMKKSLLWKMLTLHFYNTTYNWWLSWHRRHKTAGVSLPLVCIRCREIAIFESWLNLLVNLKVEKCYKIGFFDTFIVSTTKMKLDGM